MPENAAPATGDIAAAVRALAEEAKLASHAIARARSQDKDFALLSMAQRLVAGADDLLAANRLDVEQAKARGLAPALVDRLVLDPRRIEQMADGLRQVAALPDPVGDVPSVVNRPNGLRVERMRIPLGVIGIVYESRPNVTADAAGLCVKSGNAVVLRGGSEALHSNRAITAILRDALSDAGLPEAAVTLVPITDRASVLELVRLEGLLDLVVPRGGEGLVRFVAEHARVPVVYHAKGVCSVYVDSHASLDKALDVAWNAKVQRPGTCNSMETLLVHRDVAGAFLPRFAARAREGHLELRGCERTRVLVPDALAAGDADWDTEWLALVCTVRVVDSLDAALAHIRQHGSHHTDAIVTDSLAAAQRFVAEVDSSAVMVNASTRFNDGYQLGLGAELGISTSKIHCFGPMGLVDLTTTKYVVYGDGHTRET